MKQIVITEEMKQKLIQEFTEYVSRQNLTDGNVSFSRAVSSDIKDAEKAKIVYTNDAWVKQAALLKHCDKEVAWHGRVTREGNVFKIYDILVYPQTVTGVTVNTDQEEYQKWFVEQLMNDVTDIKMQAHSHVNMGTSPSSVDLNHQKEIVSELRDDAYYIFLIWNKRYECTKKIYDYANNILYEDKDIDIEIESSVDVCAFLDNVDKLVQEKKYTSYTQKQSSYTPNTFKGSYGSYGYSGYDSMMGYYEDDDYPFYGSQGVNEKGSFFINDDPEFDEGFFGENVVHYEHGKFKKKKKGKR